MSIWTYIHVSVDIICVHWPPNTVHTVMVPPVSLQFSKWTVGRDKVKTLMQILHTAAATLQHDRPGQADPVLLYVVLVYLSKFIRFYKIWTTQCLTLIIKAVIYSITISIITFSVQPCYSLKSLKPLILSKNTMNTFLWGQLWL